MKGAEKHAFSKSSSSEINAAGAGRSARPLGERKEQRNRRRGRNEAKVKIQNYTEISREMNMLNRTYFNMLILWYNSRHF